MTAHERHVALKTLLETQGQVQVSVVAREWGVSEMTVRRDLGCLEDQGLLARVHGGAVASGALSWTSRAARHRREKAAAAAKLVDLLPHGGCLYLDGSTTIVHLTAALARRRGLVVATNNIDTFQRLIHQPGLEVLLVGGLLNRGTDNFVGPLALRSVEALHFDLACFSAFALHPQGGCLEPALEDAAVKQRVCERAQRIAVAVNHHKFHQQAAGAWGGEPGRSILASDLDSADPRLDPFRPSFCQIL